MKSLLIFVAVLAGMVILGWIVSKITGSHAYYLNEWKFDPDETVVWQDPEADVVNFARTGQARFIWYPRLHRSRVIVTNKRIIVGKKTFSGKQQVVAVLWPRPSPDGNSAKLGGGLLTVGYESFSYDPESMLLTHNRSDHTCIELTPMPDQMSSTNLKTFLIFSDHADTFQLPKE